MRQHAIASPAPSARAMTENRKSAHRLDPRDPLVLDVRELGRRPGSMRTVLRTAPAPAGFGVADLIGVPMGDPLHLDLRLESVMEGVLVSGTATAPLSGECGRCLDPIADHIVVPVQELFVYPGAATDPDEQDEVARMEGDLLDLAPTLRDALVLALPLTPLCRPDCSGLCASCGERWAELPEDHTHDLTDARWGALSGLLGASTADQER